jgi:hypothetical protein
VPIASEFQTKWLNLIIITEDWCLTQSRLTSLPGKIYLAKTAWQSLLLAMLALHSGWKREFLSGPIFWLNQFIFKSAFFLHFLLYKVNLYYGIFKKYNFDLLPDTFSHKKVHENAESFKNWPQKTLHGA